MLCLSIHTWYRLAQASQHTNDRDVNLCLQGYQLGPSQLDFAITITITSATASGGTLVETLTLDPSDPYVLDDANLVSAQLLGDLLTYTALPVFTDTYLMVPSPTGAS